MKPHQHAYVTWSRLGVACFRLLLGNLVDVEYTCYSVRLLPDKEAVAWNFDHDNFGSVSQCYFATDCHALTIS